MADLKNTTINDTGFLNLPAGTTAQRPTSAEVGMIRYNTDLETVEGYDGVEWQRLSGAVDDLFYENARNVTEDYTVSTTRNTMTIGPITIESGVTVTIPDGARWVVI